MNTERLYHLITILEKVSIEQKPFDMGAWAKQERKSHMQHEEHTMCNTACCALGWAAMDPQSIMDGLYLEAEVEGYCVATTWPLILKKDWDKLFLFQNKEGIDVIVTPKFGDEVGFEAAMAYYDINADQANHLFDPSWYSSSTLQITPSMVIEHVLSILNGEFTGENEEDEDEPWEDCLVTKDEDEDEQAKPTDGFV